LKDFANFFEEIWRASWQRAGSFPPALLFH